MKRSRQVQKNIGLNWTADVSWYSWSNTVSSDWLVSLKLCSDWLDEPFKRRISKVETSKQASKQINLISCWTALLSQLKIDFWILSSSITHILQMLMLEESRWTSVIVPCQIIHIFPLILFSNDTFFIQITQHLMKHSEVFLINHIWKETQKVYFSWKQIKAQRKRLRKAIKGLSELIGK